MRGKRPALCFEHFEVLLHTVQLGLQYLLLYLRGLGYHAELFVREDHASQSLLRISRKMRSRFRGVKSSLPG